MKRYLEAVERGDEQEQGRIDPSAVVAALEKLQKDAEPEASFMRTGGRKLPAYNVQTAVDAEHALIVAHQVSTVANDRSFLEPMAEAAHQAVGAPAELNVVADAGYSNGAQAEACEARGIVPHVPAQRSVNSQGKGKLFDRSQFVHDPGSDTLLCPAGQRLERKAVREDKNAIVYAAPAAVCGGCALKGDCTTARQRTVFVHLHDGALKRMQERATPAVMSLRRCTVEHPFGTLKYRIFGHPRLLLRGVAGARIEIALGIMAYNLKRMINVLGGRKMAAQLAN
jgi:transposase